MKQTESPQPTTVIEDILIQNKKIIKKNKQLQIDFERERNIKNRLYFFILRNKLVKEYEIFCQEYEQLAE